MTARTPEGTAYGGERDLDQAPGGASCRVGYPNGLSNAGVLTQGGEDGRVNSLVS